GARAHPVQPAPRRHRRRRDHRRRAARERRVDPAEPADGHRLRGGLGRADGALSPDRKLSDGGGHPGAGGHLQYRVHVDGADDHPAPGAAAPARQHGGPLQYLDAGSARGKRTNGRRARRRDRRAVVAHAQRVGGGAGRPRPARRRSSSAAAARPLGLAAVTARAAVYLSTVALMLFRCSSMWLSRIACTICSPLIGGMPVRTTPLLARSASLNPRSSAAAAAALFLCSATVSAFVALACSLACLAFMSWSMSIVKLVACPAATVLMMPAIASWAPARWCATTPTVHFSEAVVFFQSASVRPSSTPVASCTFASNCFASASALAAMEPSLVTMVRGSALSIW